MLPVLAPTIFAFLAAPRSVSFAVPYRASTSMMSFDDLTLDEKVAMVRVAKCLDNRPEDELGAWAAKAPTERPEWANSTAETWASVRESYPELAALSDETLAAARDECLQMQSTVTPDAGDAGLSSGAAPIAFAVIATIVGFVVNGNVNPGCGAIDGLPTAAQRGCMESATRLTNARE